MEVYETALKLAPTPRRGSTLGISWSTWGAEEALDAWRQVYGIKSPRAWARTRWTCACIGINAARLLEDQSTTTSPKR